MRICLFLIFYYFSSIIWAQSYDPLPDSNARWVSTYSNWVTTPFDHCELYGVNKFCIENQDTVIGLETYSKIFICNVGTNSYKGAIRDEITGQAYFVPKDSTSEYLIMDFDVNLTDTVWNVYFENFWGSAYITDVNIYQIDTVIIWGTERRRIKYDNGNYGPGVWIAGVGNDAGLFLETAEIFDACIELECMSVNDTVMLPTAAIGTCALDVGIEKHEQNSIVVYPNPNQTRILYINHNISDEINYSLSDIQGKIVSKDRLIGNEITLPNESGIYILQFQGSFGIRTEKIVVR